MIKINDNIISSEYDTAATPFQWFLGLMFKTKIKRPLLFRFKKEAIISLHMFFVFMPIDVIFIDQNLMIVELKNNFKPFTFYRPASKASVIIEAEKGFIERFNIAVGQKVSID